MDSTALARQKRRIDRLSENGLTRSSVIVHQFCKQVLQELKPYLQNPSQGQLLLTLLQDANRAASPTNVSQVTQISPLRYPGGKTWLVPEVRKWIRSLPKRPTTLVEPFAGGATVGLTVAAEHLVDEVVLIEMDPAVSSLWELLVCGSDFESEQLFQRVLSFEMTNTNVDEALAGFATSLPMAAFATILKNRVNRGGILAPGASRMKSGENGKGLASRWYPETLVKRMRGIRSFRERLRFVSGDAFELIPMLQPEHDTAWFVDPPYTAGGKRVGGRLYTFSEVDHEHLFFEMARCMGPVMMTYDDVPEVVSLAAKYHFEILRAPMKTTHHEIKNELLLLKE